MQACHLITVFVRDAIKDPEHDCKWNRGILPVNLTSKNVDWIEYEDCEPDEICNYIEILNEGCQIGSDGSGGFEKNPRLRKMVSASITYSKDYTVFAILVSRVLGKQTVPRSEL